MIKSNRVSMWRRGNKGHTGTVSVGTPHTYTARPGIVIDHPMSR